MNIADIYERVRSIIPDADERLFINYYNDTVSELDGLYGNVGKLLYLDGVPDVPVKSINEENNLLPLFSTAVVDNIIYLFNHEAPYKQEFMRKAENAHLIYWRENTKGKTIRSLKTGGFSNDIQK